MLSPLVIIIALSFSSLSQTVVSRWQWQSLCQSPAEYFCLFLLSPSVYPFCTVMVANIYQVFSLSGSPFAWASPFSLWSSEMDVLVIISTLQGRTQRSKVNQPPKCPPLLNSRQGFRVSSPWSLSPCQHRFVILRNGNESQHQEFSWIFKGLIKIKEAPFWLWAFVLWTVFCDI